ncbi:hypothetical protein O181_030347 [Austropuccinia psidii MF-1]|uniref:Uncharacterized protein n=1 Tax=Austropuccinia psidii MF-1 TaxID=1389203 RepID=A0A9Q3H4C9_9BASI|nr:hypothetical protein [Austropuccinia psidii MF-1]
MDTGQSTPTNSFATCCGNKIIFSSSFHPPSLTELDSHNMIDEFDTDQFEEWLRQLDQSIKQQELKLIEKQKKLALTPHEEECLDNEINFIYEHVAVDRLIQASDEGLETISLIVLQYQSLKTLIKFFEDKKSMDKLKKRNQNKKTSFQKRTASRASLKKKQRLPQKATWKLFCRRLKYQIGAIKMVKTNGLFLNTFTSFTHIYS